MSFLVVLCISFPAHLEAVRDSDVSLETNMTNRDMKLILDLLRQPCIISCRADILVFCLTNADASNPNALYLIPEWNAIDNVLATSAYSSVVQVIIEPPQDITLTTIPLGYKCVIDLARELLPRTVARGVFESNCGGFCTYCL